jgi:hypothetical protein
MPRTDSALARWRRSPRRLVAVAVTAALMLLAAPLRTLAGGCDLCPPDCPMHVRHGAAAGAEHGGARRMHCHNAPGQAATAGDHAPRLTRPPCGSHAVVIGLELAPMLPASPLRWIAAPRISGAPPRHALAGSRTADPPDPPPPDARA